MFKGRKYLIWCSIAGFIN